MTLYSSHRMYDVTPSVAALWEALYARVSALAGVPLAPLHMPPPTPIDALWARPDLGLAQMCGWPFHRADPQPTPLAAPVPDAAEAGGRPVYWSDMVVRADAPYTRLEDTFGTRIAWTVEGSHSGFNAPRRLLLDAARETGGPLYAESVGPVVTPRGAIESVLEGRADIAPVDGFFLLLLRRHEPELAARIRVIAQTPQAPLPLLVASPGVPEATVAALRAALLALDTDAEAAPLMADLCLRRFVPVDPAAYAEGQHWHEDALAAGYPRPA